MISSVILIFILLIFSAFFSASETAIISLSRSRLHKLKMDGNTKAVTLSRLRGQDKEKFIGSILLGNNFVNIAASSIATSITIELFGESNITLLIATVAMTFLILILSEVMPKTYAVRHSEQVGLKVAVLCEFITKIFSPITFTIKLLVDKILHLITPVSNSENELSGLEVIRGAIELHHEEGEMIAEDKFMLGGIIDLEEILIEEVMIHRNDIKSINIDDPIDNIAEQIVHSEYSRIPIWKDRPENIIGILHIKDFLKLISDAKKGKLKQNDIISIARQPWFIPNTTNLKIQLKAFRQRHYHFALVVDEYGELLGLATLEDIVEEIVGQITDEHDKDRHLVTRHSSTSVTIDGDMTIRDLNREMNWNISDNNAATIGGLLLHEAKRIPAVGEIIEISGYTIKLLKKKHTKIVKVKVNKIT